METFYHLNQIAKEPNVLPEFKQHVRMIASEFTRIKYAQETDMGCSYVALGPPDSLGRTKVRYGGKADDETGKKPEGKEAQDKMLLRRKNLALSYKSILPKKKQEGHNEIILAYRSHGNRLRLRKVPLFAVVDERRADGHQPGRAVDHLRRREAGEVLSWRAEPRERPGGAVDAPGRSRGSARLYAPRGPCRVCPAPPPRTRRSPPARASASASASRLRSTSRTPASPPTASPQK